MYVPLEKLKECRMNRIASVVLFTFAQPSHINPPIHPDYKGRSSHVSSTYQLRTTISTGLTNAQHGPQLLVLDLSAALDVLHQDQSIIYHQLVDHTFVSLPVHLCAASFATLTASFFLSYLTGSAAPKATNSDLSPRAVSFTSRRVWSNFARSS